MSDTLEQANARLDALRNQPGPFDAWQAGNAAVDEMALAIEIEDGLGLTNRQRQIALSATLRAISRVLASARSSGGPQRAERNERMTPLTVVCTGCAADFAPANTRVCCGEPWCNDCYGFHAADDHVDERPTSGEQREGGPR